METSIKYDNNGNEYTTTDTMEDSYWVIYTSIHDVVNAIDKINEELDTYTIDNRQRSNQWPAFDSYDERKESMVTDCNELLEMAKERKR